MKDFANFDRQKSYLSPHYAHIDVHVRFRKVDLRSMTYGEWSYKIKLFCSVPIILFQCQCDGCNILMHLNVPALKQLNATSWLKNSNLTFLLLISDASRANQVVWAKKVQLSKTESDKIRHACQQQRTLSYNQIEDLVGPFYQLSIDRIWPSGF